STEKIRPPITLKEAVMQLPRGMGIIIRDKLRANGVLGPILLTPGEVADIQALDKIGRLDIMLHMLMMGAALAQTDAPSKAIGAVAEGGSGAMYAGANIEWGGSGIKFSV